MIIDKKEMDLAWKNRHKDNKFYKYLYEIAIFQVNRKKIKPDKKDDLVQFCLYKCFSHQDSFEPTKNKSAYSFFWAQISLAIAYKLRQERRRKNKANILYVDNEKIITWLDNKVDREGERISDLVDKEEAKVALRIFSKYKRYNKLRIKPDKENFIKAIKWYQEKRNKNIIEEFSSLKNIFKNWIKEGVNNAGNF